MNKAIETLQERGFFNQCTDLEALSAKMDEGPVTFYVGADPTGPSLHIGHMVPFFAFRHLMKFGHKGIALIGGGTGRIGDPSGKTEMRKMLTYETIDANVENINLTSSFTLMVTMHVPQTTRTGLSILITSTSCVTLDHASA